MTLAPRSPFFHGGPVLALGLPVSIDAPDWVLHLAALLLIGLALRMMRNIDDKWAWRAWSGLSLIYLAEMCWIYPWVRWITLSQVIVVIVWNVLLWFRGPNGRDDD